MSPEMSGPPAPDPGICVPKISVIVPVYRQWALVPALRAALGAQSLAPARFELVLADNEPGAAGPVPEDIAPLPGGPGPDTRRIAAARPGAYAARNAGAAAASGGLLVFTDADCRPEPDWLAALAAAAAETPRALLAGPVRMTAPARPGPCAIYDLVRGIPQGSYVSRGYAATANLAVPAAVFAALGGFDARRFSGGDAAFCRRAGRAGHALRLVAGAVVAHPARADWAGTALKARRIKGGQIAAGPWPRRIAWGLRTLAPPVRDIARFARSPHPARHRLIAVGVRLRLWGVELAETARLLAGGPPERR